MGWKARALICSATRTTSAAVKFPPPLDNRDHGNGIAAGFAQCRRCDLDDPEDESDLRDLTESLATCCPGWLAQHGCFLSAKRGFHPGLPATRSRSLFH